MKNNPAILEGFIYSVFYKKALYATYGAFLWQWHNRCINRGMKQISYSLPHQAITITRII